MLEEIIHTPNFYSNKPVFGLDIGSSSVKVMQVDSPRGKKPTITAYGTGRYDPKTFKNGVIVDHESLAKSVYDLVSKNLVGDLTTKRVVSAVPMDHSFSRILTLPVMSKADLAEAVKAEASQYIPVGIEDLYMDYQVSKQSRDDNTMDVLVVAAPRKSVDSYLALFEILGLETASIETTINAATRLVMHSEVTDEPTLIVDFGSRSTDLSIFDNVMRVTGTIGYGGDDMTDFIAEELRVTEAQATTIKSKYGLDVSKKQAKILSSIEPVLRKLVAEAKKMDRFYQDRNNTDQKIQQIITLGGGANLPGLADYLTDKTRIATRTCDPWLNLDFGTLQPPHKSEKTMYATVAGLALVTPGSLSDD